VDSNSSTILREELFHTNLFQLLKKVQKKQCHEVCLAGYPIVDLSVELYDGTYHDVDSSEIAFKIAASQAVQEAVQKARPVILEPMMNVEITVPEKFLGDITGNVSSKRGQIEGVDDRGMAKVVRCDHSIIRNVWIHVDSCDQ
jgi:translation elongation factor EF-G